MADGQIISERSPLVRELSEGHGCGVGSETDRDLDQAAVALGGDPSQALIHATTTGSFVITLSSVDLGQGIKTVGAQIAAEMLGVPYDTVMIDTADTDTGPHCMGTFASRGTIRA